jgi:hypothetical protein
MLSAFFEREMFCFDAVFHDLTLVRYGSLNRTAVTVILSYESVKSATKLKVGVHVTGLLDVS